MHNDCTGKVLNTILDLTFKKSSEVSQAIKQRSQNKFVILNMKESCVLVHY